MDLRFDLENITLHGETPIGSTDEVPQEEKRVLAIVKSHSMNWTWTIYEAEFSGDEILFFGLVDGFESELGYFTLSDLETDGLVGYISHNGVTHEIEEEEALDAEIEAEMRAEEEAERKATDYSYAVDSQGDDSPPADWY